MIKPFEKAIPVLEHIEQAGFEAYFVGGCVRDYLLKKEISDIDIATNATPLEIKSIFSHTFDVGIEHGTVLVLFQGETYEITTFRTESTYTDYRRPQSVAFVRDLKEDLMRRDFTINALAMTTHGKIIDYYEGIADLQAKVIRAVGSATERFNEDALRMLRAVRFSGQLGFDIAKETTDGLVANASLLQHIAVERIAVEMQKLMVSPYKAKGIQYLLDAKLHHYCPNLMHFEQALLDFKLFPRFTVDYVNWALLLWFNNTNIATNDFLKQWKLSNDTMKKANALLQAISHGLSTNCQWDTHFLYHHSCEVIIHAQNIVGYLTNQSFEVSVSKLYEELPIRSMKDLAINGKDIQMILQKNSAGKYVGDILHHVQDAVLSNQLANTYHDIERYIKQNFSHIKEN